MCCPSPKPCQPSWRPLGVSVTALCPGPVPTGFQARARFSGKMDKMVRVSLSSSEVAQIAYDGMMAGKRVVIPGMVAKLVGWTSPFTPKSLSLAVISSLQLRRRDKSTAKDKEVA